jgi:Down syndrome cell adhesion protein
MPLRMDWCDVPELKYVVSKPNYYWYKPLSIFLDPPVISVFSFDENLVQGQRTSVTCNVISGDLPIDIKWLKDYQLIPSFLNITEMRVKFLSYLIFEELDRYQSGVYTCSVSNAASTANHSATLSVKGIV